MRLIFLTYLPHILGVNGKTVCKEFFIESARIFGYVDLLTIKIEFVVTQAKIYKNILLKKYGLPKSNL